MNNMLRHTGAMSRLASSLPRHWRCMPARSRRRRRQIAQATAARSHDCPDRRREPYEPRGSIARLKGGLDALSAGEHRQGARHSRQPVRSQPRPPHPGLGDRHEGGDVCRAGEIAAAAMTCPAGRAWTTLRRNSERALYRENPDAKTVDPRFGDSRRRRSTASSCLPARMWRWATPTARALCCRPSGAPRSWTPQDEARSSRSSAT